MLIDTHCHLDFSQFDAERSRVIERAQAADVAYIVNVGADVAGSQESVRLSQQYQCVFAAVGIHPHYASAVTEADMRRIEALSQEKKIVAIGEVGLDYFGGNVQYRVDETNKRKQADLLRYFIGLAAERRLPLILHCRQAKEDMAQIIRGELKAPVRAVMHCFSQDKEFLDLCLDKGMYVSFTANITYKKADGLRALVAYAPLERILLETDAPFLAPQEHRGRRNEPAYVVHVAREIARIKNIDMEKVAEITTRGACKMFGLEKRN
ncbi:MAG: TatD family hydrolase [Candidatus Omnitrophica bacterium]|nr:TatD family hydrolase [Candidatus Omnitrophota bacterium]MBU4479379.1 TatD family hydrolase [Candidatus Omnitrophota bacterium]MCG2703239.1 TatD family hydrolase [Candidatus Omnitrophota bacterium]